jgi:ABC transport system ATP-binding/permease protein
MPVGELSGGEKARVLMAMMMREPADVLMLDEPTNDLDIRSIEVLEQALIDFPGAVILIIHDRHMLDRVCTDLIGLHGDGEWGNYASVSQWLESDQRKNLKSEPVAETKPEAAPEASKPQRAKLTYHEKKELSAMEETILAAEGALELLQAALDEANTTADHVKLVELHAEQQGAQDRITTLYARWEELEEKAR